MTTYVLTINRVGFNVGPLQIAGYPNGLPVPGPAYVLFPYSTPVFRTVATRCGVVPNKPLQLIPKFTVLPPNPSLIKSWSMH
jgi:hypothetical protein